MLRSVQLPLPAAEGDAEGEPDRGERQGEHHHGRQADAGGLGDRAEQPAARGIAARNTTVSMKFCALYLSSAGTTV